MGKVIRLILSVVIVASFAACGSAPVETDNSDAQRSRAEKAQTEMGADVSRQKPQ